MSSVEASVPIRDAVAGDKAYVRSTWFNSSIHEFINEVKRRFETRIGSRASRARVRIACDPEDESTILGYAVIEGTCLHYVYVRSGMRHLGIARKLLEGQPIETYSSTTTSFRSRIKPDARGWKLATSEEKK
jgi:hypothetical protein